MPQLPAVITSDSRGRVAASRRLTNSATAETVAAAAGGSRVRSCWRGPGGGRRSKVAKGLSTDPSSLRVTLMCIGLRHLPFVRLGKFSARFFNE